MMEVYIVGLIVTHLLVIKIPPPSITSYFATNEANGELAMTLVVHSVLAWPFLLVAMLFGWLAVLTEYMLNTNTKEKPNE